jgi:hypothetical protein
VTPSTHSMSEAVAIMTGAASHENAETEGHAHARHRL